MNIFFGEKQRTLFLLLAFIFSSQIFPQNEKIIPGAEVLVSENFDLIKGKRLGIITNHTAILTDGTHLVDKLHSNKDVKVTVLFGPEHGIRGDAGAGEKIDNSVDAKTGIPVISLYGKHKKPTAEMLKDVDILIFDIQDVGARFYTYISTLYHCLESAAENNKPILILDRPNPISPMKLEGPIRKEEFKSFVGIAPMPMNHGLTIGELAAYFAGELLPKENFFPQLTVIKIKNWDRTKFYSGLKGNWVKPSPNIPTLNTAVIYPGTCLIEGTNISEGRGTDSPFLILGAPYINGDSILREMKKLNLTGVTFSSSGFTPIAIADAAPNPKYKNEKCGGLKITITDPHKIEPVKIALHFISLVRKMYPEQFQFKSGFERLSGDKKIREMIEQNVSVDDMIKSWSEEIISFQNVSEKYLLY